MKYDVWNAQYKQDQLRKILDILNSKKYQLEDRGLVLGNGLDAKVLVGDEIEEDIPLLGEIIIDSRYNVLYLDLRVVKLKDDGHLLKDKLPAKTMASYYINKAITIADAYNGIINSRLKHILLETISLIITNNIVKHLSLDNIDRSIVSSYIKSIMVLNLYDKDDELSDILSSVLTKADKEIIDIDLLLRNAEEFEWGGFNKINNLFGGSARIGRLNKDIVKTIVMNLSNSILRPEIFKAIDYPILFLPLIIEHYTNLLYKRTALTYNIKSLKRFIEIDELLTYNKRLKSALL